MLQSKYLVIDKDLSSINAIVAWLRNAEHLAGEIYSKAAEVYKDDVRFSAFLTKMSEEEAWHYHVMGSAAECLSVNPKLASDISVDRHTRGKIEQYIDEVNNSLDSRALSKDEFIEKMVEMEKSEWNDIFHYVVNVIKKRAPEFKYPAEHIQQHLEEIATYLEQNGDYPELIKSIRELTPAWSKNILIVDDDKAIRSLLYALFSTEGTVDVAGDGREALKCIVSKDYELVISDIEMPKMDGISFYKEAVEQDPSLKSHFLFLSGDLTQENREFLLAQSEKYLAKPIALQRLKDTALGILVSK